MPILDIFKKKIYKPIILAILDGWGVAPPWGGNAISLAKKPNFDYLWRTFPHTTIYASGEYVGLTGHEVGNSEVGHLNLGGGRTLSLDVKRINQAIEDGSFFKNKAFFAMAKHLLKTRGRLHLIGLLSDAGIHSHINHLFGLLELAKRLRIESVFVHPILDGRDTPQTQALIYIEKLKEKINELNIGRIASIAGRFYAMDRDNRWNRTKVYYDTITQGENAKFKNPEEAISYYYRNGYYDENIPPTLIDKEGTIKEGDAIICFNFRSDRIRQIARAFLEEDFNGFKREKIKNLLFITFVPYFTYDVKLPMLFAFQQDPLSNTLAETLSKNGLKQLHIAETEKYAHVTYFFNGGIEKPFKGEDNILIPSPKVASYAQKPEMSAYQITNTVIKNLYKKFYHFILINFANGDMVGHTGNLNATIEAISHVDVCLGKIWQAVKKINGTLIITADHGNAEEMINSQTLEINPEHTNNPVPFIFVDFNQQEKIIFKNSQALKNVSPFILEYLKIKKPSEMDAESLKASLNEVEIYQKEEVGSDYWSI